MGIYFNILILNVGDNRPVSTEISWREAQASRTNCSKSYKNSSIALSGSVSAQAANLS